MDYTKQSPVILSLCPGIRGLERGFERVCTRLNWQQHTTAAFVEIEAFINWNLVEQMEQGVLAPAPIWSNIKTINWEIFRGKIDFIFGGYPCQPMSVGGKQKGIEDPRHLWPYIAEGIRTIRPVGCFFENVRNHLNIGYEAVRGELQEMGYKVREGIYSAEEVGAPHRRDRLFILAIREDVANTESFNRGLLLQSGRSRKSNSEFIRTSEAELSDTGHNDGREYESEQQQKEHTKEFQRGVELENTVQFRSGRRDNGNTQRRRRENKIARSGNAMADAKKPGHEGHGNNTGEQTQSGFRHNRFSARPGQDQYDWEPPRVESRLGFMLNGYNFREDFLRMAGNGVVEDTAEVAFIDLLNQFNQP